MRRLLLATALALCACDVPPEETPAPLTSKPLDPQPAGEVAEAAGEGIPPALNTTVPRRDPPADGGADR